MASRKRKDVVVRDKRPVKNHCGQAIRSVEDLRLLRKQREIDAEQGRIKNAMYMKKGKKK